MGQFFVMNEISSLAYDNLLATVKKNLDSDGDFGILAQSYSETIGDVHFTDFNQPSNNMELVPLLDEPGNGPIWNVQCHKFRSKAINELKELNEDLKFLFSSLACPARVMLTDSPSVTRKGAWVLVDSRDEAFEIILLLEKKRWRGIKFSDPVIQESVPSIL